MTHLPDSIMFNEKKIRLIGIIEDPWICAKDVCIALGYTTENANRRILSRHIKESEKRSLADLLTTYPHLSVSTNESKMMYISELGLLRLLHKSSKPIADEFETTF